MTNCTRPSACDTSGTPALSLFQQAWEEAIRQALIRMASEEADENGAATLLLEASLDAAA